MKKKILATSEFKFKAVEADIDERAIEEKMADKSDADIAMALALAKAKKIAESHPSDFVIAADSFAVLPNKKRLIKPRSYDEQIDFCLSQSGKTIRAYTGLAAIFNGKIYTDHTVTRITYVGFDKKTIETILRRDGLAQCNGGLGYSIETAGFSLVEKYCGSYTGAMGLPMEIVRKIMKEWGYENND
jgi:septum formation protein